MRTHVLETTWLRSIQAPERTPATTSRAMCSPNRTRPAGTLQRRSVSTAWWERSARRYDRRGADYVPLLPVCDADFEESIARDAIMLEEIYVPDKLSCPVDDTFESSDDAWLKEQFAKSFATKVWDGR